MQQQGTARGNSSPGTTRRIWRRWMEYREIRRLSPQGYRQRVRRWYDGPAGAALKFASLVSLHEPLVGQLFRTKRFDVSGCHKVLDVGSGAGQIVRHLLRYAADDVHVVGYDLSHSMLCRARVRTAHAGVSYVVGDMLHLPFPDNTFDLATMGWVLEYLPDPRPGLAEIHRVLQPGGRLFLMATEDTFTGVLTSQTWKCRTFSKVELRQACDDVGLTWARQLWFTPVHRLLSIGGIIVELRKPLAADVSGTSPA